MAKFINFKIVGGYDVATGAADSSLDGDNLVNVENILNFLEVWNEYDFQHLFPRVFKVIKLIFVSDLKCF